MQSTENKQQILRNVEYSLLGQFEFYSERQRASVSLWRPLGELHVDASD